jgi:hypothetical protein
MIARPASRVAPSCRAPRQHALERRRGLDLELARSGPAVRGGRAKNIGVSRSSGSTDRLRARSFMLV